MIRYILLFVAFQLLFLVIYDLFLKRETFFQWNRVYLIGSFILSLVLPFIKLEVLTTVVSQDFAAIVLPEIILTAENVQDSALVNVSWTQIVFIGGAVIAFSLFVFKMYQLIQLRRSGRIERFSDFIKVIVPKSTMAFSFYRTVFLGEDVSKQDEEGILQHELVHIKQKHTLDLLFFEVMRVVFWFNPLVYVYQSKISELHEFIADAQVSKTDRKAQYELLLSQIFQTKNISFINHFFKSSLIKKRIVMLQKSKSSQILKFKYLLLLPLVAGMLFYTSCETESETEATIQESSVNGDVEIIEINRDRITEADKEAFADAMKKLFSTKEGTTIVRMQGSKGLIEMKMEEGNLSMKDSKGNIKEYNTSFSANKNATPNTDNEVPFSVIEEKPIFPGCEDATDKFKCFQEQMFKHIRKNFNYPEDAQEKGIQGKVFVSFNILEDGSIGNVRMRGPDKILEEAAARIIGILPKMTGGKQRGRAVKVPFSIPITFKLQ